MGAFLFTAGVCVTTHAEPQPRRDMGSLFRLYMILFRFKALLCESIILLSPPPPACKVDPIAILLRGHCAIYTLPPTPLLYAKHHTMLVMAISCKGQIPVEPCRAQANLASARYCHYYYCMVYGIKKEVGGGAYLAQ